VGVGKLLENRTLQSFWDLKVWQKGHQLALAVYKATSAFPKEERYGLTTQMRRASTSIPANIAEGCGRSGGGDFARFLQIAMGSASELEYFFLLSRDLGLLDVEGYERLAGDTIEIKRMLASLIEKVKSHR
jgi:four helix bundle protein